MEADDEETHAGQDWVPNANRKISFLFSHKAACTFLKDNKLLAVIRAHEVQENGYHLHKRQKDRGGFPAVITVFSAPNYCDNYNNKAAVIRIQNKLMNVRQFHSVEHPYVLPERMNAFDWSVLFVAEKVTELLTEIWSVCDEGGSHSSDDIALAGKSMKDRIRAMGKMAAAFKGMREDNNKKMALGALANTKNAKIKDIDSNALASYKGVKNLDSDNEALPDMQ